MATTTERTTGPTTATAVDWPRLVEAARRFEVAAAAGCRLAALCLVDAAARRLVDEIRVLHEGHVDQLRDLAAEAGIIRPGDDRAFALETRDRLTRAHREGGEAAVLHVLADVEAVGIDAYERMLASAALPAAHRPSFRAAATALRATSRHLRAAAERAEALE